MPIYGPELDDPVSIPELLRYGLETKPDEDALISLDTRHTWRELDESSSRLAAGYLAHGFKTGGPNCFPYAQPGRFICPLSRMFQSGACNSTA